MPKMEKSPVGSIYTAGDILRCTLDGKKYMFVTNLVVRGRVVAMHLMNTSGFVELWEYAPQKNSFEIVGRIQILEVLRE